jgi:clan AA aspartic protease
MVCVKDNQVGRFSVEVELANDRDLARAAAGDISPQQVRRLTVRAVIDSGASRLVIPTAIAQQLGLPISGETNVRYADGRIAKRPAVAGIHLTWGGRSGSYTAVVEPDRDSALLGAIVLEDLDLIADCSTQTLRPRDPERIVSEIE